MKTPHDTTAASRLEFVKIYALIAACVGAVILTSVAAIKPAPLKVFAHEHQPQDHSVAYRSRYLRFNEYLFNGNQRVTAVV